MALPVNIQELVHGNTIEWKRLEFGSPAPVIESNEECTYMLVTLPAHPALSIQASNGANSLSFNGLSKVLVFSNGVSNPAGNGANGRLAIEIIGSELHDRVPEMLEMLSARMRRSELFEKMDLSNQSKNRTKYLDPLIEAGWVAMEFPQERTHPNQTYQTTASGMRVLQLINKA